MGGTGRAPPTLDMISGPAMKVLYLCTDPAMHPGHQTGYGTHMRQVIRALRERGHEIDVHVSASPVQAVPRPGEAGLRRMARPLVPRTAWEGLRDLRRIWHGWRAQPALDRAARRLRPDVLYERLSHLQRCGAVTARREGLPLVVEVNSPQAGERLTLSGASPLVRAAAAREREVLGAARRVVVVSTALAESLIEQGLDATKVRVVPNAVDPRVFDRDTARGEGVRASHDLGEGPVIGFVGAFLPWHGIDRLLDAVAALDPRPVGLRVLLVGDGFIRDDLRARATDLGLSNVVTFTGTVRQEDVPEHVAAMDVCVMPASNWYGSPIKIFEYGAMGKPIVGPDVAPVREVLEPGRDGLVAATTDDLRAALARFLDEPVFARDCGERFREKVLARHTWGRVAEELEECFEEARAETSPVR